MSVLKIDSGNFQEEVINSEKSVLLDFYADWCGPCKTMSRVIDEIAEERTDIKVCKINIDDEPELAIEFEVMSIPTLVVVKGGKAVNSSVGVKPKAKILEML